MKKAIIISAFVLLFAGFFVQTDYSHAAEDTTPPWLETMWFKNHNIQYGEYLEVYMDIKDKSDISEIVLSFRSYEGVGVSHSKSLYPLKDIGEISPGARTFNVKVEGFLNGTYRLESVTLLDSKGNQVTYVIDDLGDERFAEIHSAPDITITGSDFSVGETDYMNVGLNSLAIRNPESVDAKGDLTIDMLTSDEPVYGGYLYFSTNEPTGVHTVKLFFKVDSEEYPGAAKTITIPIKGKLPNGVNTLTQIVICRDNGNKGYKRPMDSEEWTYVGDYTGPDSPPDITREISVSNSSADYTAPEILNIDFDHELQLPSTLNVDLTYLSEDDISRFYLGFTNGEDSIYTSEINVEKGGAEAKTVRLKVPVDSLLGNGGYTLNDIFIEDKHGNINRYFDTELDAICGNKELTFHSPYDVTYEGDLSNTEEVLNAVEEMKEGETAVLDAINETVVPKALFESIAGKDKTVVCTTDNTEWIFNGKDISQSAAKRVNVQTQLNQESGKQLGFDEDKKVLKIDFGNNGALPGKTQVRIHDSYISNAYSSGQGSLILTRIANNKMDVVDTDVQIEGDRAAVCFIKYGGKHTLSKKGVSLRKASILFKKKRTLTLIYNGKERKPSFTVRVGSDVLSKNEYKPRYEKNKKVGTAKLTVKSRVKKYTGSKTVTFIINPKKAAIAKITAGKKKITVRMKSKPSKLGASAYKIKYRVAGKKTG
ncbi:MAG: hypothetical protein Q4A48_01790 [Bacillota bacterium]|nr:hypothetical protein [Bacillota bacterium]